MIITLSFSRNYEKHIQVCIKLTAYELASNTASKDVLLARHAILTDEPLGKRAVTKSGPKS